MPMQTCVFPILRIKEAVDGLDLDLIYFLVKPCMHDNMMCKRVDCFSATSSTVRGPLADDQNMVGTHCCFYPSPSCTYGDGSIPFSTA